EKRALERKLIRQTVFLMHSSGSPFPGVKRVFASLPTTIDQRNLHHRQAYDSAIEDLPDWGEQSMRACKCDLYVAPCTYGKISIVFSTFGNELIGSDKLAPFDSCFPYSKNGKIMVGDAARN